MNISRNYCDITEIIQTIEIRENSPVSPSKTLSRFPLFSTRCLRRNYARVRCWSGSETAQIAAVLISTQNVTERATVSRLVGPQLLLIPDRYYNGSLLVLEDQSVYYSKRFYYSPSQDSTKPPLGRGSGVLLITDIVKVLETSWQTAFRRILRQRIFVPSSDINNRQWTCMTCRFYTLLLFTFCYTNPQLSLLFWGDWKCLNSGIV